MLKVGYDAQAFLSPNGGTGKGLQLRNLLGPFAEQFSGFASTESSHSALSLIQEGAAGYTVWQQFSLPRSLSRHGIDLFLAPYNTAPFVLPRKTALVLVLHDMILMKDFRNASFRNRLKDVYRRWQIPASVRRAKIVLTVSEHARGEILQAFPKANVRVIPCTVAEHWYEPRPLNGREGHLLMVTSSAPHKNARRGIEGYARYARSAGAGARPLKIVGLTKQASEYAGQLRTHGVQDLVKFLSFVSEAELLALYQGASALLFPSLAEGFGIPVLEAMATGTPVIASNVTSLPEVGGDAGYYFDPEREHDIAKAIETVLGNPQLREEMAAKGRERAQVYHPKRVGRMVLDFWEETADVVPESTLVSQEY